MAERSLKYVNFAFNTKNKKVEHRKTYSHGQRLAYTSVGTRTRYQCTKTSITNNTATQWE